MDFLSDLFYFIYVVHRNAFVAFGHFIVTNLAFAILFFCILYVFNRQNVIVERETIRPIRRTLSSSPHRTEQSQWGGEPDDIVLSSINKMRFRLIVTYAAIILSILICFFFATRVVLYMLTAMWVVGALSVLLLKGDRKEMADNIQNWSLGYCLVLIVIKIMISLVIGTPVGEWSRSLGVALPASAAGTLSGYLPMMFLIMTLGIPLAYFRVVAQKYSIAKDNEDVTKRRAEIMRTGNQNRLHEWSEEMYKSREYW